MENLSWLKYLYLGRQIRKIALLFPKTFQNELISARCGQWDNEFSFVCPEQSVKVYLIIIYNWITIKNYYVQSTTDHEYRNCGNFWINLEK